MTRTLAVTQSHLRCFRVYSCMLVCVSIKFSILLPVGSSAYHQCQNTEQTVPKTPRNPLCCPFVTTSTFLLRSYTIPLTLVTNELPTFKILSSQNVI